ncbi:MAG: radical SAM family heme chaperone HemW [Pseudomonadota bacterium]
MTDDAVWDWRPGGFGLYVHWPFCQAKCPYCDFNSHVSDRIDHPRWQAAFLQALTHAAHQTAGRRLDSIFFGGGTPSLMAPDTVAALIAMAARLWTFSPSIEITLEANPTSVEVAHFRAFADAGVNRISIGIQSFIDRDLRRLGRKHSAADARAAYDTARAQFNRVSFDLIYARQDQSLAAWRQELAEALAMQVDHLSLYQLTIEPGTPFAARLDRGGLHGLPDIDGSADLYEATQTLCKDAGMPAYEVSNHALPGQESRHNLVYWNQGDWVGIGPGAHGRLTVGGTRRATETWHAPEVWLAAVARDGHGQQRDTAIAPEAQFSEALLMGLRLSSGIDLARYRMGGGDWLDSENLECLVSEDFLWQCGARIGTTEAGRPVLNHLVAQLLR